MLVAEKKHHIETHIYGKGADYLVNILRQSLPNLEVTYESENDEEYIDSESSEWYMRITETMTPGVILRIRRENSGMTQVALSQKSGIAVPNISLMESGKRNIGLKTAKKLSAALNCNVADFFL